MLETSCAGILLYYKYVDLTLCQEEVKEWFLCLCEKLQLKGRIRVAKDGINCTVSLRSILHMELFRPGCMQNERLLRQVGGSLESLHDHIRAVRCHDQFGDDIDFKLAESQGASSEQAASETGFRSLSVSVCEVTNPSISITLTCYLRRSGPGSTPLPVLEDCGMFVCALAYFRDECSQRLEAWHAGSCSIALPHSQLQPCQSPSCSRTPCIAATFPQHHSRSRAALSQGGGTFGCQELL